MEASTEKRILCRFSCPELDFFSVIAEQSEVPEIGIHMEIPMRLHPSSRIYHAVMFYVTDVQASPREEDVILCDVEVRRV